MNTRDPLAAPAAAPLRILMVEDDPNDAELIRAYLEDAARAGAQVRHVRTLAEALEGAADAQVTLLDLDLPDSAGLATLERMRAATAAPLIVVSGNGHPALVEEALRRRAYDVIPKHQLDAATLRRVLRLAAQHEEASRAQRAAEGRYRALVETSSEALVLLDAAGRVDYASAAMRRILGFDSSEALGRFGLEFVQPEDRALVQGAFGELRERPGAQSTMRVRFRHKDGGARVLESTLLNRLHEPDVAAVVCSYRDLTESETQRARFTATFETSPVGLAHVDLEGRILIANQRLCDMLGYAREELIGRRVGELSHPEDTEVTAEQVAQLRAGELPQFTARKRYLRKDGGLVWVQLSVSLEYDAAGLPSYEIAAFEDITEMERAKLRGERLARMYAALSATNEATLKATDASALYRRVCELLVEHAGLQLAAVRLVDPTTHWLETVAHAGEPSSYLAGARIRVDDDRPEQQGPTMSTVVEGRTVVSNDYLAEPGLARWHASARAAGIAAMMGVPLRRGGRPIGLIALYAAERGWFDPELVLLAERMAENISFALDNLDREAARKASEERFRALTEMSSDFYWETDAEHRFRLRGSGSRPASQSTFSQDAWIGKARWELPYLSPDEAGWAAHRAALDARQPIRDFVFSRPCEETGERFIMVSGDPVFDADGAFLGYRGIGTDITEQRASQQILELEHAVAQHLATAERESDGIEGVMRTVCTRLGWEQGRFWRVDDAAGVLKFGAHWGSENADAMREVTFRPGEGLAGAVWRSGEPLWVADAEADARTSASAQAAAPLRAAFLFPVLAEGKTLGVFTFASDRIRPPNERLLKAVGVIGGQIGLFLQRRRSEAALRESEARFRSLSELSSDYFWETDAEHRFTVRGVGSQPSAQATFPQGVRGKRRWELPYLSPGREAWMAHKATLDAHLPFRDFELSRPTPDGGQRYFAVSGEPMFDAQGAFLGYRGVGRDVTERRMAQRILELEHAVAQRLARAESEPEGVQSVLRAICERFRWEQGRFWRVVDPAGVLRLGAYWSEKDQSSEAPAALREMSFGPGEGIAGHVWQTGEPHWAPDAMADPRNDARLLAQAPLRAVFIFPVRAEGRVLGVLTFGSDEIRAPNDRLLRAVRVIGDQVGGFLQRKRSEEAQRRFRAGMDASADMILLIDPQQMRYVDVNETVCRALGYSRDEMLAMGPQDLMPISREELQAVYEKFIADPGSIYGMVDSVYRCKDGSLLPFESTRRLLETEGGPLIVAISRDTRERKQAERALRESEARFRSLTELSSDWYWEQDAEYRFTVLSGPGAASLADGEVTQYLGKTRWETPDLEPVHGGWEAHRALLERREKFHDIVLRRRFADGSEGYMSVSGEPVFDAEGRFAGYRGVARNVTDKVRAERALRESEARFRSLTELSADWYWEQDAELRFVSTGGQDRKRGGITAAQHDGLRRWELPGTEPLEGDWESHKALLAARRPFRDFMLRRTGNDGAVHYVSVSGEPVFGEDGSFRGYRGIAKDVTASFEAVGAMRRFRAALDISGDAIYLVDIDAMRIVDLNESGWRNLGYAREDLLGKPPSILFSDVRDDKLRSQYERMLARGEDEQPYQTRHRRKDGSLVPVEVTRRTLVTPEGRYVIGIARDLTDRLRDEARLRESHARFEIVSRATNDVVWDWNLVTDEIWWNENFQELFGYEPGEIGSHIDSWTSRIHLEDLARVKAEIATTIERGDKSWAGEYRFRRKDGAYADVFDRGLLIHDDQGRAVRMIGAMMDISERKRAESRMRAHAQRQEAAAAFGRFALGRRNPEELYAAAAQALRTAGVDASVALEILGEGGEYVIRAAQGEGPHAVVGQRGKLSADSVWPDIQREGSSRIAGRAYLSARPTELPWGAWVRTMGSAVYSPVREGERPVGMLCVYAAREHAFGAEDVRFVDSVSHVLSTALQRHKAEQRLAHLAQFDALTGLPNRSLLQDRLDQTIVQSRRKRWHAGVLFVDLDHFKLVNDSLGHHIGDALIREVGQRLLSSVRPGDTVGRISGDEFAVVLADLARPDDAALVAQKVLDALAQPFDLAGNEAYVTASIGIAAFPEDGDDAETLIKNADMAMYRAKESARNSYCFFTAEMNQRTVAKVQLSADLRRAIERGEFTLHFQPKVALDTGELRGLEALLRWNHPTRGMVSPAEFVPALEDSGLILPVGEWVIAEACAQVRQWELAGLRPVPIAVNLSAKQFMRRDLDRTITHTLAAAGVPPRLLELEITESCLMHNPEEAIRVLNALREAGLKISVDDFGTGYSSLAYLARFPLSALKIDRAFVRNVHSDANSSAIVRAVIDMANNLELQVVAEGVETEEQAEFLRSHGCHQAQGYLYSRPVPAEQLVPRLRAAA